MNRRRFTQFSATALLASPAAGTVERPHGLMLNLDFESAKEGLIPSKSLFPLYIPQGELGIDRVRHRNVLGFEPGQGLDIPHSSLLDPNGDEWVVSIRVYALTDGLILSQGNDHFGYAVYMDDGQVFARVRTGHSAFTLQEDPMRPITKHTKRWVTIELRIEDGRAMLSLNRQRSAFVQDQPALNGKDMRIRIGTHRKIPSVFSHFQGMETTGFTGVVSSFKIHRQ